MAISAVACRALVVMHSPRTTAAPAALVARGEWVLVFVSS
jgi:hypothetical protein